MLASLPYTPDFALDLILYIEKHLLRINPDHRLEMEKLVPLLQNWHDKCFVDEAYISHKDKVHSNFVSRASTNNSSTSDESSYKYGARVNTLVHSRVRSILSTISPSIIHRGVRSLLSTGSLSGIPAIRVGARQIASIDQVMSTSVPCQTGPTIGVMLRSEFSSGDRHERTSRPESTHSKDSALYMRGDDADDLALSTTVGGDASETTSLLHHVPLPVMPPLEHSRQNTKKSPRAYCGVLRALAQALRYLAIRRFDQIRSEA